MLDVRQLVDKGVPRVSKALKLIMKNKLGFFRTFHSSPYECLLAVAIAVLLIKRGCTLSTWI